MATDLELAWLAGIIDGEGCICGHWINRKNKSGGNLSIEIRVEATSLAMITRIAEICESIGIGFSVDGARLHLRSTKTAHRINIRRQKDVLAFLVSIRPFLVVKLGEADVAIAWYERWGDQRGRFKVRATLEQKQVVCETLKSLKLAA